MPEFCLPKPSKRPRTASEVDKERAKCRNFVYRSHQNRSARPRSRQKRSKKLEFCLPNPPKSDHAPSKVDKNGSKCPNFVYAATPQYAKKRPDPVAALPINLHHFTLAAILTSVSIFFPFNVYKTLPLFHVSTFSPAVASSCPPPFVLGAGR